MQKQWGQSNDEPSEAVTRAVVICRIVGVDAMPDACCNLYDDNPSRDLWRAVMLTWLEQVHSKCVECFSYHCLKCSLDYVPAVRTIDPGTISWWPTECPAYLDWYKLLYPDRNLPSEEKFQALCKTYAELNQCNHCCIPAALAQTCWMEKKKKGKLLVDTQ